MTNTKKVSTFRCIVIFMTILLFLYAMAEVLIASSALNGTAYKNALRYERDYNKLAEKYTAVDFTIACLGMNPEARAENARLQALWREEWQDFDELTAYYSRSDEAVKQLEETTKECRLLASQNGSIASSIEDQAKERQYIGTLGGYGSHQKGVCASCCQKRVENYLLSLFQAHYAADASVNQPGNRARYAGYGAVYEADLRQ